MNNKYPWYDSEWLDSYVLAKEIIQKYNPSMLEEFINKTDILKTRSDFKIINKSKMFDKTTYKEIQNVIKEVQDNNSDKEEFFRFGRKVVWDNSYLNELQIKLTNYVSEVVQEPVEPSYNFLSLYNNLGVCGVHMDAPYAKWTLDVCINQSEKWPIYFSRIQDWPEKYKTVEDNWQNQIKSDVTNDFSKYELKENEAVVFSGSSQWHYRDRILKSQKNNYCHLAFFHYIPEGSSDIVDPSRWAGLFKTPELSELPDGKIGKPNLF